MDIFLEIVRKPAVIIAIVTMIGLIATKQKFTKVVAGTLTAFIGFTMIKLGSAILSDVLKSFSKLFNEAFGLKGIVPSNESVMSALLADLGSQASMILVVGLIVNILLARFTLFKTVYLSLHLSLFTAFALASIFTLSDYPVAVEILIGGLALGTYMAVSPWLLSR